MTSKFFNYDHSFDFLMDHDPLRKPGAEYWYLKSHDFQTYSWASDFFTDKEIRSIIISGKRLQPKRSTTGVGENCLDHRRSFTSWISPNDSTAWLFEKLAYLINDHNEKYFQYDLNMIERLQFTYYNSEENGMYKQHTDPLNWSVPHNRKLSLVVQLSDPKDYEGGELKLYNGHEPITVDKEKGMIVCFPSYTLHEVTPVTKGERYSLVVWVHGPAFK